jgi:hypothetical protein
MSNDYFLGTDLLGAEIVEKPFVVDDPDWGKPLVMGEVDILGIEHQFMHVLGFIDMGQAQNRMDDLKVVTIGVAQALLKGGYDAINGAISGAKQPFYKPNLPGDTARQTALGKLNWHRDNLAKFVDKTAPYPNANDLKKWVMQSYIEANAVEEGALYISQAWGAMWAEIESEIAKLPQKFRDAAKKAIETVTGVPVWGWALVGVGAVSIVGGIVYAVLNSRSGAALTQHVARRYLP